MAVENLNTLIANVQNEINAKSKELTKLETDYEELVALKKGFSNALEMYKRSTEKDAAFLGDSALENNRCMQMFRNSMTETLDKNKVSAQIDNLSAALDKVSHKVDSTLFEIKEKEDEISNLKKLLSTYQLQLSEGSSAKNTQEG